MVRVIYLFLFGATYLVFGGETALTAILMPSLMPTSICRRLNFCCRVLSVNTYTEGAVAAEFNRTFRQRERLLGTFSTISALAEYLNGFVRYPALERRFDFKLVGAVFFTLSEIYVFQYGIE